jgi:hypothetical protein
MLTSARAAAAPSGACRAPTRPSRCHPPSGDEERREIPSAVRLSQHQVGIAAHALDAARVRDHLLHLGERDVVLDPQLVLDVLVDVEPLDPKLVH